MLYNLFQKQPKKSGHWLEHLHNIHVHHIIAGPVVFLLAMGVMAYSLNIKSEFSIADTLTAFNIPEAHAQERLFLRNFTSVDVMKLTKDVVANQLSPEEIRSVVAALSELRPKYIAISIPLDATADYKTSKPKPLSAEQFTKNWADAIHEKGMKVLWRGTWSGIEGIYNFPKQVGSRRFPAGTAASAATDGNTTWLGKTYGYITAHPDFFENGDIWAPLPERTENIFNDSTSFLPHSGGIQKNYAAFFSDLKKVSDRAFAQIGIKARTGWTANNFSEVASGWLPNSFYAPAGIISVDYYGISRTPAELEQDLKSVYKKTGRQIFVQEWADYWNGRLTLPQRRAYLASMYQTFQKLADQGVLAGFNYWGGWPYTVESILTKTSAGYELNDRGLQLAEFFNQD